MFKIFTTVDKHQRFKFYQASYQAWIFIQQRWKFVC